MRGTSFSLFYLLLLKLKYIYYFLVFLSVSLKGNFIKKNLFTASQVPTTTMLIPTLEPGPCKYGWTDWFNTRIPDARGDYETIQSSRIFHSFCSNDMINAIECRQVGKKTGLLQNGVICDLDIGLKCNSEYMFNNEVCSDYEVRFFCDCPTIAPPIGKLILT